MTRVLRLTRHEAGAEQVRTLAHKYGEDVEVLWVSEKLSTDPREAVQRFDELSNGFDVVEAVLPINLLEAVLNRSEFCRRGGKIIRAHMVRNLQDDGSATFAFSHYEWMKEVRIVTEVLWLPLTLQPQPERSMIMGYYADYELHVKPEMPSKFLAELEKLTGIEFHVEPDIIVSDDRYKWYDHDNDMTRLSAMFPGHRLSLYGMGEERGDIWVKYYQGGKNVGRGKGRIVYDPPPWEVDTTNL